MRKVVLGTCLFACFAGTAPLAAAASSKLYVSDTPADCVVVVDTATNAIVGNPIPIEHGRPRAPVVSANGATVYVQSDDGTIAVIDAESARVIRVIDNPNPGQAEGPASITLSPDGARLYALGAGIGSIAVVDTRSGAVVDTLPGTGIGDSVALIRASHDGDRIFVLNRTAEVVQSIDTTTHAIVAHRIAAQPGDQGFSGMVVSPDDRSLLVSTLAGPLLTLDATSLQTTSTQPFPRSTGVDISPDGQIVMLSMDGDACFGNLNLRTLENSGTGVANNQCESVAAARDSRHAYVANYDLASTAWQVFVFDAIDRTAPAPVISGFSYPTFDSQSIGPASIIPEAGTWWNPEEPGRAFSIDVRHGTLALIASVYDTSGKPTWFITSGDYDASSGLFAGNLGTDTGGQCLGCDYRAPTFLDSVGGPVQLKFDSPTTGQLVVGGRSTPIRKFDW